MIVPRPARAPAAAFFVAALLAGLLAGSASSARAEDDLDDLMGGFEDELDPSTLAAEPPASEAEAETPEWLRRLPFGPWVADHVDLSGSIASGAVWNYRDHDAPHGDRPTQPGDPQGQLGRSSDFAGLSRLDLDGLLRLDVRLPGTWTIRAEALGWYDFAYRIKGRGDYGGPVLDVYEWQVDSGEVYASGPIHDHLDLTVGRKIVNWGRSDTFRIVDVVNPLDNKEPGLVDIEDLRRPRTLAKLDFARGAYTAEAIVAVESRFDRNPPPGSDFYPDLSRFASAPGFIVTFPVESESSFARLPGVAGRFEGNFSGWDFGLFGAWIDETSRVPDVIATPGGPALSLEANRFGMLGAAGNLTRGAWLAKVELAWLENARLLRTRVGAPIDLWTDDKDRIDSMIGLEWYGPDSLSVALEIVNRHWLDLPRDPGLPDFFEQSTFETGLRVSRPFFRERLDVTLLGVVFGERAQDGGLFRASAEWELSDDWKTEGGILLFLDGPKKAIGAYDKNDRFFLEFKYSF